MVIEHNNKRYNFNDSINYVYTKVIGNPISFNDICMYLSVYTKQDPEISLRTLCEKDVVYIVEKCIKDEIIDIYGQETWNKHINSYSI